MVALRTTSVLTGLLAALLLSGCSASNGPEGNSLEAAGTLSYNGASNGQHSSTFDSDGSCTLHVMTNLGSGAVAITLRSGEGTTVQGGGSGPGNSDDDVGNLSGAPGRWTLTASRTSNEFGSFSGNYMATALC